MTAADLDAENMASWVTNAQFWDDSIGANGNVYWRKLQEPSLRRLVSAKIEAAKASADGCRALDISTGNGLCARWLVDEGASPVRAVDGSSTMIEVAKARMAEAQPRYDGVSLGMLDVTDPAAFAPEIKTAAEVIRSLVCLFLSCSIFLSWGIFFQLCDICCRALLSLEM